MDVDSLEKLMRQMFADRDAAADTAREAMNTRLEQMNELRAVVTDTVARSITRQEHERVLEEVKQLRLQLQQLSGVVLKREDLGRVVDRMRE